MKRILLVDDDEMILECTQFALEERGYEVLLARDGTEALKKVEQESPDLVVLDVVMPRRSGFGFLDRISERQRNSLPVIVVSGDADEQAAEVRGANAFLRKPFDMAELLDRVEALLSTQT